MKPFFRLSFIIAIDRFHRFGTVLINIPKKPLRAAGYLRRNQDSFSCRKGNCMVQGVSIDRCRFGFWRQWLMAWIVGVGLANVARGQGLHLTVAPVGPSQVLEVSCTESGPVSTAYYVLLRGNGLEHGFPHRSDRPNFTNVVDIEPVNSSGPTKLRQLLLTEEAGFYEVLAVPPGDLLTLGSVPDTTNNVRTALIANLRAFLVQDSDGDGIPNQFEVEHGLSATFGGDALLVPSGDNRRWRDIYSDELFLSSLPVAYFRQPSTTVVAGAATVSLDVGFSKPFSGKLFYTLGGTAVAATAGTNGDYILPSGSVGLAGGTSATITVRLLPGIGVSLTERSLVVSLSTTNVLRARSYTVGSSSLGTSVHTVRILPSSQGVYLGTLAITNGLQVDVQSLKMAVRPATNGSSLALFDSAGSLLLGDVFSVPVTADGDSFQLTGGFTTVLTGTSLGRDLSVGMAFGSTTASNNTFHVPVTMTITGLTASGRAYAGQGSLDLVRVQ